jgi:hypothetical protein
MNRLAPGLRHEPSQKSGNEGIGRSDLLLEDEARNDDTDALLGSSGRGNSRLAIDCRHRTEDFTGLHATDDLISPVATLHNLDEALLHEEGAIASLALFEDHLAGIEDLPVQGMLLTHSSRSPWLGWLERGRA